ncbi:N2227-like protein-domain-containing protein [Lipomyces oligophaga]|uniref:N2227-like protein-domain-containing protein n=1 Tax=Lipomyces oligophaga TaxID=45792 RepID=UPI0034CF9F18
MAFVREILKSSLIKIAPIIGSSERQYLIDSVAGLGNYTNEMKKISDRRRTLFSRMSASHQRLVKSTGYTQRIQNVAKAIKANERITASIADYAKTKFKISRSELLQATPSRHSRVVELLKHFVRDWSEEGARERRITFTPILDSLLDEFGSEPTDKRVLVPGAGVGRLAYDISQLGFTTEANEYSYLMHLGHLYILSFEQDSLEVYPFIHSFSYQKSEADQLRPIAFPDLTPTVKKDNLSATYGDFLQLKGQTYNAIVTLFFIDTAEDVLTYIETIHRLLEPEGVWINCGPLKWGTAPRVEFTVEELLKVLPKMGFKVEKRWSCNAEYVADSESLWHGYYGIEGWVARKV